MAGGLISACLLPKEDAEDVSSSQTGGRSFGNRAFGGTMVGSGVMADALSVDDGMALIGNTLATGAILAVLIAILWPLSGAHCNPVVRMVLLLRGALPIALMFGYIGAQIAGGARGADVWHLAFGRKSHQPWSIVIHHNPTCGTSRNVLGHHPRDLS